MSLSAEYHYEGSELDLFAQATNWKSYWSGLVRPYMGSRILEVGAGIGSTIPLLCGENQTRWLGLEPDANLADKAKRFLSEIRFRDKCEIRKATLSSLKPNETFDTVLYIDVLEHIQNDKEELLHAARHLNPGGTIIVLSPAYQWLYSPFDEAIGHFRRYNKSALIRITPATLKLERLLYLDSAGLIASGANRLFLKSKHPTKAQIRFWDRVLLPISRILDPVIKYNFGKSILSIWRARG